MQIRQGEKKLVIAVDAMGGDNAPEEVVRGAMAFVEQDTAEVVLVGDETQIAGIAKSSPHWERRLHVVHAPGTVPADVSPTEAVRKHKDSSIVVAARLVKDGKAQALVSAGSTGVTMVAALMSFGRIRGVERPAIATVLPTLAGPCVVLDVGANVDSRPSHLAQFAGMGAIYAERVLDIKNPRVAVLSNGEEEAKGNELVVAAHQRIKEDKRLNFIGNLEAREVFSGTADVLVCDGFVGNVVLKLTEGMASALFALLRQGVNENVRSRLGGLLLRPALKGIWNKMDYTEYGGALLLGVSGVCVISHGASNAKAISNAVRVAKESVEGGVTQMIANMSDEQVVTEP